MKKTAVIYKSQYGSTRQYAQWIAETLGAELLPLSACKPADFARFDVIVFGGWVCADMTSGAGALAKAADVLQGKELFLFTVSLSDPADAALCERLRAALAAALPAPLMERARLYHFQGALDVKRVSFLHRCMLSMVRGMMQKKPAAERTETENSILQAFAQPVDFTNQAAIQPLVEAVRLAAR